MCTKNYTKSEHECQNKQIQAYQNLAKALWAHLKLPNIYVLMGIFILKHGDKPKKNRQSFQKVCVMLKVCFILWGSDKDNHYEIDRFGSERLSKDV